MSVGFDRFWLVLVGVGKFGLAFGIDFGRFWLSLVDFYTNLQTQMFVQLCKKL